MVGLAIGCELMDLCFDFLIHWDTPLKIGDRTISARDSVAVVSDSVLMESWLPGWIPVLQHYPERKARQFCNSILAARFPKSADLEVKGLPLVMPLLRGCHRVRKFSS